MTKDKKFEDVVNSCSALCKAYDSTAGRIVMLQQLGRVWAKVDEMELTIDEWRILQNARGAK